MKRQRQSTGTVEQLLEGKYRRIVDQHLEPAILRMGFTRYEKDGWKKETDGAIHRIGAVLRLVPGYDYAWVGVGIGIGYPQLAELLRNAPSTIGLGEFNTKAPVMMGSLLRKLLPGTPANEWRLDLNSSEPEIAHEILAAVHSAGIPFWERFTDIVNAVSLWKQRPESRPSFVGSQADMFVAAFLVAIENDRAAAFAHIDAEIGRLRQGEVTRVVENSIRRRQAFRRYLEAL